MLRIIFGDLNSKYKNIRINSNYQKKDLYKTDIIAYLPQHQLLPENIKIRKAFKLFNVDWNTFAQLFESFKKYNNMSTNKVSSGELRVIETYLILNSNKAIILLDEPFSFIAPIYMEKIKLLIAEKKTNSAIIISDHFYRDILEISDEIYFLKDGYSKVISSKEDLENEGYITSSLPQK